MDTPIADFVKNYSESQTVRFHMPGHKGRGIMGFEALDITEIKGADALYEASGIIEKSESNATALFGTQKTVYSTEGSSQCIRAMLYLAIQHNKACSRATRNMTSEKEPYRPLILAARNVHKAFLYAGALLDIDVEWLYSPNTDSICSCIITPDVLEDKLTHMEKKPAAVYITSPDYLGGCSDIKALADICHKYDTYLLVDNAHGAYTRFLPVSTHPMDLGADLCCDSAHKTLPVLTGGAYLHIGKNAPKDFADNAKQAMALFGSTSPSYLILQSLDLCNLYMAETFRGHLCAFIEKLKTLKNTLVSWGWDVVDTDPLKLVIRCNGFELADRLRASNIECEYADPDYLVLMLTPLNRAEELEKLLYSLGECYEFRYDVSKTEESLPVFKSQQVCTLRQAIFAAHETIPVNQAVGRICATPLVSCPPAIPIVISGERITKEALTLFEKYCISEVEVVKEPIL